MTKPLTYAEWDKIKTGFWNGDIYWSVNQPPKLRERIEATFRHGLADSPVGWRDVAEWLDARNHPYWSEEQRGTVLPDRTWIDVHNLGGIRERLSALGYGTYTYCGPDKSHATVVSAWRGKSDPYPLLERPTLVRLTRALAAIAYGLAHNVDVQHLVEDT